jgi:hypothetical protein
MNNPGRAVVAVPERGVNIYLVMPGLDPGIHSAALH